MSRCKTEAERLFYLQLATTERYSTRELDRQINSSIFKRTLLAGQAFQSSPSTKARSYWSNNHGLRRLIHVPILSQPEGQELQHQPPASKHSTQIVPILSQPEGQELRCFVPDNR
jgi:hypothetical protein